MKKITLAVVAVLLMSLIGCSDYESEVTSLSVIEEQVAFMFSTDSTTVPDTLQTLCLESLDPLLVDVTIDTTEGWYLDSLTFGSTKMAIIDTLSGLSVGLTGTDGITHLLTTVGKKSTYAVLDMTGLSADGSNVDFYFNNYITVSLWTMDGEAVDNEGNGSLSPEMLSYAWTTDYQNVNKINVPALDYVREGAKITLDKEKYIIRFTKAEAIIGKADAATVKVMIIEN